MHQIAKLAVPYSSTDRTSQSMIRARIVLWGCAQLVVASLLLVGCGDSDVADSQDSREQKDSGNQVAKASDSKTVLESWDVIYVGGDKVGYFHWTVTQAGKGDPSDRLKIVGENKVTLKRFGQRAVQSMRLTTLETRDGQLLEFSSSYDAGGSTSVETLGRYSNGKLVIDTATKGKQLQSTLPWEESWGGFFAVEHSLRGKPMRPGEMRTLKALQPLFNQVAEVRLVAKDYEETPLLAGQQKLLRIETSLDLGGQQLDQTLWTDDEGDILKSFVPGPGLLLIEPRKRLPCAKRTKSSLIWEKCP